MKRSARSASGGTGKPRGSEPSSARTPAPPRFDPARPVKRRGGAAPSSGGFTHLDSSGRASMVDVGEKPETRREAEAEAFVTLSPLAFDQLVRGKVAKGDAFAVARIAGIQGGKRAAEWIPLAHPLPIEWIGVELLPERAKRRVRIVASASVTGKTGIEMEAMVAASAAALALYDMCKALDRGIVLGPVRLLRKSGGRSGEWRAEPAGRPPRRPESRRRG